MKKIIHLLLLILLIGLDQFTKYLVVIGLKGKDSIQLIPKVLQLHYHENTGAVWGIMSGKVSFLIISTTLIMVGMIALYFKIPQAKRYNFLRILMVVITAGAIGNLIDRCIRNYVVDFIYFELINFPIFNVADIYVTVSAVLLILSSIFYYKDEDFDFLSKRESKINTNNELSKDVNQNE